MGRKNNIAYVAVYQNPITFAYGLGAEIYDQHGKIFRIMDEFRGESRMEAEKIITKMVIHCARIIKMERIKIHQRFTILGLDDLLSIGKNNNGIDVVFSGIENDEDFENYEKIFIKIKTRVISSGYKEVYGDRS